MNAGSIRWGVSYLALLWAMTMPAAAGTAWHETVVHSFGGGTDGSYPTGSLTANGRGGFYGTTSRGGGSDSCGQEGCGIVFELTPPPTGGKSWTENVLYRFQGGADGAAPLAGLLRDRTGALYGTTSEGGVGNCHHYYSADSGMLSMHLYWVPGANVGCGTVFKLTPPAAGNSVWNETVLYRFDGTNDRLPPGSLLMDRTRALYGVTAEGGSGQCGYFSVREPYHGRETSALEYRTGCGTVFKLTPPAAGKKVWIETRLHTFHGGADGSSPERRLVESSDGSLYGTTTGYNTKRLHFTQGHFGTVFELAPPKTGQAYWTESTLRDFDGDVGDHPSTGLILDAHGNLYGGTTSGGCCGEGSVFELSPPAAGDARWTVALVYSFYIGSGQPRGGNDVYPTGITADKTTGGFYGTTSAGGNSNGCGAVFQLIPPSPGEAAWTQAPLHDFNGNDGCNPQSSIAIGAAGDLFGTAEHGGEHGFGSVFKLTP